MGKPVALLIILASTLAACSALPPKGQHVQNSLSAFTQGDHFAAAPGGLYTGVADPTVRALLNAAVASTASALAKARAAGASDAEVLALFQQRLRSIDRDSLDTEDAEQVAAVFEQMLEAAGLESSEGALNDWMYGFDVG